MVWGTWYRRANHMSWSSAAAVVAKVTVSLGAAVKVSFLFSSSSLIIKLAAVA